MIYWSSPSCITEINDEDCKWRRCWGNAAQCTVAESNKNEWQPISYLYIRDTEAAVSSTLQKKKKQRSASKCENYFEIKFFQIKFLLNEYEPLFNFRFFRFQFPFFSSFYASLKIINIIIQLTNTKKLRRVATISKRDAAFHFIQHWSSTATKVKCRCVKFSLKIKKSSAEKAGVFFFWKTVKNALKNFLKYLLIKKRMIMTWLLQRFICKPVQVLIFQLSCICG